MSQRKSSLNPYATPFVPVSKRLSGVGLLEGQNKASEASDSGKREQIIDTARFQLSDTSVECNNPRTKDPHFSDASSSKIACQAGDMLKEESACNKKQVLMEEYEMKLDSLCFMYSMLPRETLAEFLCGNSGDLDITIEMLEMQKF